MSSLYDEIIAPMVVDEQESVPDMFGDEPVEQTEKVFKRQVHRHAMPSDKPRDEHSHEKEPEEVVTLQDGTVVRKTVTIRKHIVRTDHSST